jgi:hypothetical protein
MSGRTPLRLVIGGGGVLLIGSLFMPWARGRSGWELLTTADVFLLNGATDLFGVVAIVLTAWLAIFDFPAGSSRGAGVFVALAASMAIAGAAGDYGVLRGASWFPRLD